MSAAMRSPLGAVLRNEWRLSSRGLGDMLGGRGRRQRLGIAALVLLMVTLVFGIAYTILTQVGPLDPGDPRTQVTVAINLGFVFILMISAALDSATFTLYSRSDYDLLFSAPIPPRLILLVRSLSVFCFTCAKIALYGAPFLLLLALDQGAHWLQGFPLFAAMALAATAIAIGLAMGLVRSIGIRRTRVAAQVLAAFAGLLVFVMMQWDVVMPAAWKEAMVFSAETLPDSAMRRILLAPAMAMLGDLPSLIGTVALAVAFAALMFHLLAKAFVEGAILAAGAEASAPRTQRRGRAGFGRSAFANLALKERRLILRDPWILSQILMQCLFLLPISAISIQQYLQGKQDAAALAPLLVVLSGQIAGGLAWIALAADDAPDLVATAPLDAGLIRRAKLFAVAWLTAVFVAAPLMMLLAVAPQTGLLSLGGMIVGVVAAILINLWHQPAQARAGMIRRRAKGSTLVNLMEISCLMLIGTTVWLIARGHYTVALAAAGSAALVLAILHLLRQPPLGSVAAG